MWLRRREGADSGSSEALTLGDEGLFELQTGRPSQNVTDGFRLPPGAAKAAEGLFKAASSRRGDVVRLAPSQELADGLRDGTMRYAQSRRGDLAIVKNVKTGKIAGHARVKPADAVRLAQVGAVAWQVLAIATSQHYLGEINAKLEGVAAGVEQLIGRDRAEQYAILKRIETSLELMHNKQQEGVPLTAHERQELYDSRRELQQLGARGLENASVAIHESDAELSVLSAQHHRVHELEKSALPDFYIALDAMQLLATASDLYLSQLEDEDQLLAEHHGSQRILRA